MKYDFDKVIKRKNTDCYKWDYLKEKFGRKDLVPMWVADMDFRTAPEIIKKFSRRTRHGVFGYSFRPESYYNSIIDWMKRRHEWEIEREWIINTPGVVPAINFTIQALTDPGDRILIQTPVYDPFFAAVKANRRELVISPLKLETNHYRMDFADLERKLALDVKLMILCSPHNPVGRVWTRQELTTLMELCSRYGVYLISDEIHSDLVFKGYTHIPAAEILQEFRDRTITLNAPSKTFNVAGLVTSYAIIPEESVRARISDILFKNHLFLGNIYGNLALQTAYEEGEEWLEQLVDYLQENYVFLCDFLRNRIPGLKAVRIEGTYLAWLDFRAFDLSPEGLKKRIIDKAKLGLTPGEQYGESGTGFYRLNFGCPRSVLEKALVRLEKNFEI